MSEAGGNWNNAINNYKAGNGSPGNVASLQELGISDPTCFLDIRAPDYPTFITDLLNSQFMIEGDNQVFVNGSIKQSTHSPAWLAAFITVTNPANILSFDAMFQSSNGAEGLESIFWDTNVIGLIDERIVGNSTQHFALKLPTASSNSLHMLGFRLDPFANIQSVIIITNVSLSYSGVSQPFSLSFATNGSTGSRLFQLNAQPGFEYSIQASTNLIDWTTVASLVNTNGVVQFFDSATVNFNQRFYRAVAPY